MNVHGGMSLADYLITKLDDGRKFTSSSTRWNGDVVTVRVKDDGGDVWTLTITKGDDDG